MSTNLIAMGIAIFLVLNLVIGLAFFSLFLGAFETLFGKPKLFILKPTESGNVFAFGFKWNSAKEPAKMDYVKIRLFNPFGNPTQIDVTRSFAAKDSSFAQEVDMGESYIKLLGAQGFDKASLQVEVGSQKDGVSFQFDMKGPKFAKLMLEAKETTQELEERLGLTQKGAGKPPIDVPIRSFVADTVPGKGNFLKIATNPAFAGSFTPATNSEGGSGEGAPAKENFNISKVWIEPGCIVCNACEDIYPEVFEVKADTCIVRPNPPLDDGLRIEESAEACPVEVIKFTKAG